jgi:hypothetical protein
MKATFGGFEIVKENWERLSFIKESRPISSISLVSDKDGIRVDVTHDDDQAHTVIRIENILNDGGKPLCFTSTVVLNQDEFNIKEMAESLK